MNEIWGIKNVGFKQIEKFVQSQIIFAFIFFQSSKSV